MDKSVNPRRIVQAVADDFAEAGQEELRRWITVNTAWAVAFAADHLPAPEEADEGGDENPRYALWREATGGGPNYQYISWINGQWSDWQQARGYPAHQSKSTADHTDFDLWLFSKVRGAGRARKESYARKSGRAGDYRGENTQAVVRDMISNGLRARTDEERTHFAEQVRGFLANVGPGGNVSIYADALYAAIGYKKGGGWQPMSDPGAEEEAQIAAWIVENYQGDAAFLVHTPGTSSGIVNAIFDPLKAHFLTRGWVSAVSYVVEQTAEPDSPSISIASQETGRTLWGTHGKAILRLAWQMSEQGKRPPADVRYEAVEAHFADHPADLKAAVDRVMQAKADQAAQDAWEAQAYREAQAARDARRGWWFPHNLLIIVEQSKKNPDLYRFSFEVDRGKLQIQGQTQSWHKGLARREDSFRLAQGLLGAINRSDGSGKAVPQAVKSEIERALSQVIRAMLDGTEAPPLLAEQRSESNAARVNRTGRKAFDSIAQDPRIVDLWNEGSKTLDIWADLAPGYNRDGVSSLHVSALSDEGAPIPLKDVVSMLQAELAEARPGNLY